MQNIQKNMEELQNKIGYQFHKTDLLKQALTHSSFSNEQKINKLKNYERLEFLGDAVLELVSSDFLFNENPTLPEGELTKLRASMVCEPALAYCAKDINLGKYILLGKGEEATGGRNRDSITADVMEAVIGAIYMDGGIEPAKKHILRFVLSDLENKKLFYDSKTILQEMVQKESAEPLLYELISEKGPDHDKVFHVAAKVGKQIVGEGSGRTKKAAEQSAAYQAIIKRRNV